MSSHVTVLSLVVAALLLIALWLSVWSMRRRLQVSLEEAFSTEWKFDSEWYTTSVRATAVVSGRRTIVELVGTVQLVLRIAVECRTKHAARVLIPTGLANLGPMRDSRKLDGGMVVITKQEEDRDFMTRLAETVEGNTVFRSLLRDASADLLWFREGSVSAFFRRRARRLLAPERLHDLLAEVLSAATLAEQLGDPGPSVAFPGPGSNRTSRI